MSRILMVGSEATPFAKTGGLADVLGALPSALHDAGHEVAVVMPRYGSVGLENARRVWDDLPVTQGSNTVRCAIYERRHRNVTFYFLDCPPLYDRGGLYNAAGRDFPDNHLRFGALSLGALCVARSLFRPDILHLHDWQAALAAVYLRWPFRYDPSYRRARVVFTIHNLEHQGRFAPYQFRELGLDAALLAPEYLEFYGDVNLMKGGIVFSDAITTVSPRYAEEIQTPEFGFGLDGLLRAHAGKVEGILNGADYCEWSPENDPFIAAPFSADDPAGKRVCKANLLETMGLPAENLDRPVLGIVSRLARQKGFQLLSEIARELMQEDVCLVVLGSGEAEYENFFRTLKGEFPDRVGEYIGYNNELAHKIEAGADIFLMPSLFEPCGLNQIYSLRYGTIPVVRSTGGLEDSVTAETGFKFYGYDSRDLMAQIRLALMEWRDPVEWRERMRRAMCKDYSWGASASLYSQLYARLLSS